MKSDSEHDDQLGLSHPSLRIATHIATDASTGEAMLLAIYPDAHGLTIEAPVGRILIVDVNGGQITVAFQHRDSDDNFQMGGF